MDSIDPRRHPPLMYASPSSVAAAGWEPPAAAAAAAAVEGPAAAIDIDLRACTGLEEWICMVESVIDFH